MADFNFWHFTTAILWISYAVSLNNPNSILSIVPLVYTTKILASLRTLFKFIWF